MWEILESPWLVMPSKMWTPPSSMVRGPPLSPWQGIKDPVKIFSSHLVGATTLSTRAQHRALDFSFISRKALLAIPVAQDRNLDCCGEVN